ncbi:MAG TPA: hypothetical protein VIK26_02325 [Clostridium sp.]
MKRNINCKLVRNRIFNKNLYVFVLAVLIILELWSFRLVEQKKEKVVDNQYVIKEEISLTSFMKELEKNEMDIVNMNKKSKGYEFKVVISGTKEDVKKKVEELDGFNISSYELDVKDKLIKGTLTISTIS